MLCGSQLHSCPVTDSDCMRCSAPNHRLSKNFWVQGCTPVIPGSGGRMTLWPQDLEASLGLKAGLYLL